MPLKALGHGAKFSTVGSKLTARARSKYAEALALPRIDTAYYAIATERSRQADNGSRRGLYCSKQAKDL